MKAEAFIKVLRTIINEEVRKVVREELNNSLNENIIPNKSAYQEPRVSLRDKYRDVLSTDNFGELTSMHQNRVPLNKEGKPAVVNLSGNGLVNSILAETAQQMRQDPGSGAFYEGLR
jgi:hypothetical protein